MPTIIYGYFALLFVTPLLQKIYPELPGFNVLSAGIVMGIMIIPYVSSLSEDAMRAVPMSLREGSYAMGATRFQTAVKVVVPAALSGIAAAYILGISRAVGETMILAVAAGMQPNLTLNPLEPAATITSYIVQVALGDLPHGSIGYQTIFAAGLTLMLLTLFFNLVGLLDAPPIPGGLLMSAAGSQRTQSCARIIRGAQALGRRCSASLGLLAMMVGILTLAALFADMAIDGVPRLIGRLLHLVPVAPCRPGGHPVGLGRLGAGDARHRAGRGADRASPAPSTSRSTRARTGSPTSSRSTSPTSPACRRSSTACWRSACSSTRSASARASCRPA